MSCATGRCGKGESWDEPPRRWLAGAGCDGVVFHFGSDDPLSYAATWNAPLRTSDPSAFSDTLDRWLDYYRRIGITALCAGAVVVRRRPADHNWIRALALPERPEQPAGEHVLRLFEDQDLLASLRTDDALLDARLRLLDRHEVHQILSHHGVYDSQRCMVVATSGLRLAVEVDPEVLQVLLRLDGSRTLRDVAHGVAGEIGFDQNALLAGNVPQGTP